jgi:hypothetical protein
MMRLDKLNPPVPAATMKDGDWHKIREIELNDYLAYL